MFNVVNNAIVVYTGDLMATEDAKEGLNSFIEKRKPVWKNK